jgi:uncharacterized protein YxjI
MLPSNHLRVATLLLLSLSASLAWVTPSTTTCRRPTSSLRMNFLNDIGDMMSGGKLVTQSGSPPYGEPLGCAVCDDLTTLAIQERAISFTGEDFDVVNIETNQNFCRVRGAMLHLPGKDKMKIKTANGDVAATLDRVLMALTPTYDIMRGDSGDKIGWLEKAKIALTDTFSFHVEGEGGVGPFKPPAAYRLEGDFSDRRFVMKNSEDQVVAKVTMDRLVEFDAFNHYQVQVAKGMDPILVIACACAIDEEFDEEHKKRREEREKSDQ